MKTILASVLYLLCLAGLVHFSRAAEPERQIYLLAATHSDDMQIGVVKLDPNKAPPTRGEGLECRPSDRVIHIQPAGTDQIDQIDVITLDCGKAGRFEVRGLKWYLNENGKINMISKGVQP